MGTPTFNNFCIKCFYNEDMNKEYQCDHPGCMKAVAEIEERILNGEVGGGASSVEDAQARNLQLTIQELQNDVAELKATVTQLSQQINALCASPAWQGESSTWAWR
jgi:outer membrane murein-binding lipoprotein Lpp